MMKFANFVSIVLSFFVHISSASPRAANTSDIDCQKFNAEYDPVVFLPTEAGYVELSNENWSATAIKTPSCIFRPDNTTSLASVVKHLQQHDLRFAIRSGGHLPSPGAANIDDGVLIDLGGFDKVEYDAVKKTATVGSGLRWKTVYEQLDQFNVTVVGGRVLEVGVGGLILGSGLSYLSDMYGLACDNVVNFEVVLGDGNVVDANNTTNKDLFWALKGGSNNLGIVTRFTLSTYPNRQVWGGVKSYALEDLPALYKAMYEYQTVPHKDPKANLMMQGYFTNTSVDIILNMIYLAADDSPAPFEPFYHINTTSDTTKIASLAEFLTSQGPANFPPRVDWRATSFTPDKSLYEKLSQLLMDSAALRKMISVQSGTVAFGLQPISTSAIQAGFARGGNALGLQPVNQTWYVIDAGWAAANDDQAMHVATKDIVNSIENEAVAAGQHLPYIFMNDASYDQEVIASYGKEAVAKLRDVSARYDPHQVFQKLVPGGFKLPAVERLY